MRAQTGKRGVDVVIDTVGDATWAQSLGALGKRGRLVTCGGTSGPMVETDVRRLFWNQWTLMGSTMGNDAEFDAVIAEFLPGASCRTVDSVHSLERGADAFARLASGAALRQGRREDLLRQASPSPSSPSPSHESQSRSLMKFPLATRYSDYDTKGHVNNAFFLTYFEAAKHLLWREVWKRHPDPPFVVAEATVRFLSPAMIGEPLEIDISTKRDQDQVVDLAVPDHPRPGRTGRRGGEHRAGVLRLHDAPGRPDSGRRARLAGERKVLTDARQYSADEERAIREAARRGEKPACPRCNVTLTPTGHRRRLFRARLCASTGNGLFVRPAIAACCLIGNEGRETRSERQSSELRTIGCSSEL